MTSVYLGAPSVAPNSNFILKISSTTFSIIWFEWSFVCFFNLFYFQIPTCLNYVAVVQYMIRTVIQA